MFGPNVGSLEVEISNDGGFSWTNLQTITGAQQTSQAAAWIESIVDISAYANDTVIVRFTGDKTTFGNQSDIAIDDVGIDEAPACPKSTGLQVTSISATEATLSWTAGGGSAWWIEYGPVGFTPGSGTTVSAPTNPFTVTGLMANTGYEFYVIDSCNAFAISDQSIPIADTTECNLFVAPYMENFDGSSFLVGGSINNPGAIDGCWERTFANSYFWSVEQNGTVSANTGPSADHTTGAGKFMFTDGFGQPQQTELTSPRIDLTALNAPELRFWYHMYGATIDRMEVDVWNGSSWNNEFTLTGQQQNANTDPWSEAVVSLSSYLGDTIQVRFVGFRQGNQTANDMALDDVWIGDSTACARPDSATLITATTNSITIQWNNYSGIGSVVQYRPAGSTTPFIQQTTTGGTATLSGLSPSTTYEIFIKDSCGVGNTSLWTSGYLFSTLCGTLTAPWSENFDGAGWFPGTGNDNNNDQISACWFRSTNTGTRWGTGTGGTNSGQTGPSGDFNGGGQYIYTEATIGTGRSTIESPFILLPALLAQPTLEYYYHMFGAGIDSMYVRIDNGSGFVTRKIYLGQQQNANGAAWLSDTIDLTSFIGDSVQIQFVGVNSNFQGDIAIDQVSITGQIITCGDPTAISFSNIGNTSAIVNWTSNSGTSELEVVPTGQAQGTGTLYTPVTSPFTVTGLSPLTSYDVYVRDVCGTQLSNWEDSTFTTTACPAVAVLFNFNDNLLNVSFNGSASTGADTLSWTFGDGNTAIGSNVNNVYTNPGTYTITLIGYNACGNADTATQTITICDSLVADFSLVQTGDTILFNGSSSFGASNYRWDFGDGNDTTGIVSGLHQYAASGVFTVTLTVYNDCGDSISITKTAQSCGPPQAIWSFTVISTTSAGMLVQFDGSTSLNGNTFSWDFGDGNTNTTSAIPQHTYLIPSLQYTVSLTVTNLCGDSHNLTSRMDQISITELQAQDRRIEVYPNPADEEVYIELIDGEKIEEAVLSIYEVGGKRIFEKEVSIEESQQKAIDVKNLPPGHYTLELKTDEYRQHYPLIIR
jgi:PKD repeat protein